MSFSESEANERKRRKQPKSSSTNCPSRAVATRGREGGYGEVMAKVHRVTPPGIAAALQIMDAKKKTSLMQVNTANAEGVACYF
jgi:hypothetical protein